MLPTTDRVLINDVCRVVLAAAGLSHLWMDDGPVPELDEAVAGLGQVQRTAVTFARLLWSGESALTVSEILDGSDADHLVVVGTLFVAIAYGEVGIRDWLEVQDERRNPNEGPKAIH